MTCLNILISELTHEHVYYSRRYHAYFFIVSSSIFKVILLTYDGMRDQKQRGIPAEVLFLRETPKILSWSASDSAKCKGRLTLYVAGLISLTTCVNMYMKLTPFTIRARVETGKSV